MSRVFTDAVINLIISLRGLDVTHTRDDTRPTAQEIMYEGRAPRSLDKGDFGKSYRPGDGNSRHLYGKGHRR
jgi:hypothetical protein